MLDHTSLRRLLGCILVGLCLLNAAGMANAQTADTAKARKAAEEALRNGLSAQGKRDHKTAVGLLSRAIASGTLQRKQLALALYRRAISYRASKKPAQALSDLNSALFFRSDLTSKDREAALSLRERTYKDAGLSAPALSTATASAISQGPAAGTAAAPGAKAKIQPRRTTSTHPPTAPILGPDVATNQPIRRPAASTRQATRKPAPATTLQKTDTAAPTGWQVSTTPATNTRAPATRQKPQAPASGGASSNPLGQFFNNLFGGGAPQNVSPQKTGSLLPPARTSPVQRPAAGAATASSSWTTNAQPASTSPRAATRRARAEVSPPRRLPPATRQKAGKPRARQQAASGRYEIQVAVLRNKAEAEGLSRQIMSKYRNSMKGGRSVRVAESILGNMGMFYAVRVGGYVSERELTPMCRQLKSDGLDCHPVARR